jgi:hypothetical protein
MIKVKSIDGVILKFVDIYKKNGNKILLLSTSLGKCYLSAFTGGDSFLLIHLQNPPSTHSITNNKIYLNYFK